MAKTIDVIAGTRLEQKARKSQSQWTDLQARKIENLLQDPSPSISHVSRNYLRSAHPPAAPEQYNDVTAIRMAQ